MNRKLAIAVSIGLALATTACAEMRMWGSGGSDGERSYMSGMAPVDVDPAGTATIGTGSVSYTGADRRIENSTGMGLD